MAYRTIALAVNLLLATIAQAHFVWLEIPVNGEGFVHMRFAEAPLEATNERLQSLSAPMKVTTAAGAPIEFQPAEEMRVGKTDNDAGLIVGYLEYGVMDRRESGGDIYLLEYHAKGARDVAHAGQTTDLAVDILATIEASTLTVTVNFKGKPVEGSELVVDLPIAAEQVKATTDAEGQATFPIETGGWVGVRAMVPETRSGTHDDKAYEAARHYGTLTFPHLDR